MKKQLLGIGLAVLILTMSAGNVQAKEINNPFVLKKPPINKVEQKNTNYFNHKKHIIKAQKQNNKKFALKNQKNRNYVAKAPNRNFNYNHKPNFNKTNMTLPNKGYWNI